MSTTVKHTLFHLILVMLIQQYLSGHPQHYRHKYKRAILQDAETNQTLPASTVVTLSVNETYTTLSSAEREEQLRKLREAEQTLRKNLKEKGKEYENQLYESWPKYVDQIEKAGPNFFHDKEGAALLGILNHTMHDVHSKWDNIMKTLRGPDITNILINYFNKIKNNA